MCGASNPIGTRVCGGCGRRRGGVSAAPGVGFVVCPSCRAVMEPSFLVCSGCAASVHPAVTGEDREVFLRTQAHLRRTVGLRRTRRGERRLVAWLDEQRVISHDDSSLSWRGRLQPTELRTRFRRVAFRIVVFVTPIAVPAWLIWRQRSKLNAEDALAVALVVVGMAVVIPVVIQLFHVANLRSAMNLFTRGVAVMGEITDRKTRRGEYGSRFLLFVSFHDENGTVVSTKLNVSEGDYRKLSAGDSVPLVFAPRRRKRARLGPRETLAHTQGFDAGCLMLTMWFFGTLGLWLVWAGLSSLPWPDVLDEPRR